MREATEHFIVLIHNEGNSALIYSFAVLPVKVLHNQSAMYLVGPCTDSVSSSEDRCDILCVSAALKSMNPLRVRQLPSIACLNSDCSTVV